MCDQEEYNPDTDINLYTNDELKAMLNVWKIGHSFLFSSVTPIFSQDKIIEALQNRSVNYN
jgi:hypothetical protein